MDIIKKKANSLENISIGAFLGIPLTLGSYSQVEPKVWSNVTQYITNSGYDPLCTGVVIGAALGFLATAYFSGRNR